MLRTLLFLGAWMWTVHLTGQIQYAEAHVSDSTLVTAGTSRLDSLHRMQVRGATLGDLLPLMGWNLTTTGASGQAQNIRTGGFSADHAAVFWGGLELNSMTLGSADLSLLPLFLFPNAQVSEMPQVGFVPSSAFSGAIQLAPEFSNPTGLQGECSFNNLQNATVGLRYRHRSSKAMHVSSVHGTWANNQFDFTDHFKAGSPVETQQLNDHRQLHVMHQYARPIWENAVLKAQVWGMGRSVQIPPTEGSYGTAHGFQEEGALRASVSLKGLSTNRPLLQLSHAEERFAYSHFACDSCAESPLSNLPSRRTAVFAERSWHTSSAHSFTVGSRTERQEIKSDVHGHVVQYRPQFFTHWGWPRSHLSVEVSQMVLAGALPQATVHWIPELASLKKWQLRAQLGHRNRVPDFNELYWRPGGNPDLKSESGWTAQVALLRRTGKSDWTIQAEGRLLREAIVWVYDGDMGAWTPVNEAVGRWIGGKVKGGGRAGPLAFRILVSGQIGQLRSDHETTWKEAPFVPQLQSSGSLHYTFKRGNVWLGFRGQSAVNRGVEAFAPLDGFVLINAGLTFNWNRYSLEFQLQNIFNQDYRLVPGYPLPGRVAQLNFIF